MVSAYGLDKEESALYLLVQLSRINKLFLIINIVYLLIFPIILLTKRFGVMIVIACVFILISRMLHRYMDKRMAYADYVCEFASGWAEVRKYKEGYVSVTSRNHTYAFKVVFVENVPTNGVLVSFITHEAILHPTLYEQLAN